MSSKNKTQIVCYFMYDTEKAFRAEFKDEDGDTIGDRWFPKSQVKQVVNGEGGFVVVAERGEEIVVEIPQWLLEKDDIAELVEAQLEAIDEEFDENRQSLNFHDEREDPDDDIPF